MLSRLQWLQWPELARAGHGAAAPEAVTGYINVFPARRRQVLQQRVINRLAVMISAWLRISIHCKTRIITLFEFYHRHRRHFALDGRTTDMAYFNFREPLF